ncbi:hypothetical protein [Streptomyces sp. NPDC057382]|uniref:hypothetical protein n=1 Tax=unclassified Streptomyces TaxID=2593676 RepID=UPI00362756BA
MEFSAAAPEWTAMCRASWGSRRLRREGPAGGEQRGSSGVGERDRLTGVYGVAGVLGDQAGVLQPP